MSVGNGTYTLTKYALMPSANFTANKTEGIVPLTVKFTDTSTNSPTDGNGTLEMEVLLPSRILNTYSAVKEYTMLHWLQQMVMIPVV